jgi:hypothetical protein
MGADRVLVSLLDFKSSVAAQKVAGWVRFPHAPAMKSSKTYFLIIFIFSFISLRWVGDFRGFYDV